MSTGLLQMLLKDGAIFIVQTVFVYRLSKEFLGASGLFSSILNVLNIAELGIGNAISYALYRPLAEGDTEQVKALMAMYRKAYLAIGLFILGIGLCLIPILPYIVKDRIEGLNLNVLYLLYLINSSVSYFFFSYKSTLLIADQKKYVVNLWSTAISLLTSLAQILILLMMPARSANTFYTYTVAGILGVIVTNLFLANKVDSRYPYIKEKKYVSVLPETRKSIFLNIGALSISRISRSALDSADSIIISATLAGGLALIGKYTNYTLIVAFVNSVFTMISASIVPSLGNYIEVEGKEKSLKLYSCMNMIFTWMYGFCFICLWVLIDPFIGGIWINEEWLLPEMVTSLLCINFMINGMDFTPMKFIQAAGLYWQARYRYVISAILNVGLSLLFGVAFRWGLEGVVFATTLAMIGMTCLDPYIVFRKFFGRGCLKIYIQYIAYFFAVFITGILTVSLCRRLTPEYTLANFILRILICIAVPNTIWFILMFRTKVFKETFSLLKKYALGLSKGMKHGFIHREEMK